MMTKKERLIDLLQEMNHSELVLLHNDYCAAIDDFDNQIYDIDQLDEICQGQDAHWVACRVFFGDFNPSFEYFKFNAYGNIQSICKWGLDRFVDIPEIVDYILEHDFSFENNDVLYILDDIEEEEENA